MGGKSSQSTQTVSIPPEVLARYNAVNARAETAANTPFQQYSNDPNAFVAQLSPTQQAGIAGTNAAAGMAQPYYGAATNYAVQGGQAVNPGQLNVGQYLNP
jgi:arginine/ornithine N-succinyltransferase beta subunit